MKNPRVMWVVEILKRDGQWHTTEDVRMTKNDATEQARIRALWARAHWDYAKSRVVKYVPAK